MDYSSNYNAYQCDEDVWYNKDKLFNVSAYRSQISFDTGSERFSSVEMNIR